MVATLRRGPTIYQLTLKQAVRRKRRRVTLIAAFKCLEGVVICADSQETLSVITPDGPADYRCQVTKIRPEIAGQYYVVGGGAGDGDLIEAFTDRLLAEVQSWEGVLDAPTIKEKV